MADVRPRTWLRITGPTRTATGTTLQMQRIVDGRRP
jgi:hypothetical protein